MISFAPACISATTNLSGVATVRIRIAGTFTSPIFVPDGTTDGRFLKEVVLWTKNGTEGDRIYDIRVEDDDELLTGIWPAPAIAAKFPEYPVVGRFDDQDAVSPSLPGIFIKPGVLHEIGALNTTELRFCPSGFSLVFTFETANAINLGQVIYCNYFWGKFTP